MYEILSVGIVLDWSTTLTFQPAVLNIRLSKMQNVKLVLKTKHMPEVHEAKVNIYLRISEFMYLENVKRLVLVYPSWVELWYNHLLRQEH